LSGIPPSRRRAARAAAALCLAGLALAPAAIAAGPPGGLDARAWEPVSPAEKSGGAVGTPGSAGAGVMQAAASGNGFAFGSPYSFGEAEGSLAVNQYLASRGASSWVTQNLTPPALSGTYAGGAYLAFSEDLSRSVLSGGDRCREGPLATCPAQNPPLGPGGPPGYRNLYLRQAGSYAPIVTAANFPGLPPDPQDFHPAFEGASPDLGHVVFSAGETLYEWSEGSTEAIAAGPGVALAAERGAVSAEGNRIYWSDGGELNLREGGASVPLAEAASFQAASKDGSIALYVKAGHLYRYQAVGGQSTDLTPAGGVLALVGSSEDAATLYYVTGEGLYRRSGAAASRLLSAGPSFLPPATGPARAAADGTRFFFTYPAPLRPTDTDGLPDAYEWEAQGAGSCTQAGGCFALLSGGRAGSATFLDSSASGEDAFFATEASLLGADTDSLDVYDARAGGGFPEAPPQPPCFGDDCQGPAPAPDYRPPPSATIAGHANPPPRFRAQHKKHKKKHKHRRAKHRGKHAGARR
jgi:hypothetical protein